MTLCLSRADVVTKLRTFVAEAGSQQKAADALGCSATLVSFVLNEKIAPSPAILEPLGLVKVTHYVPTTEDR